MKKLTASLTSSLCIISETVHTSWGCHRFTLKIAFHVLILIKLNYAAPKWQLWLSATNFSCWGHLQTPSQQLATDQLASTPLEALHLESDIQTYHTCSNWLILRAWEKTSRSTNDHPKRVPLAADVPQRLPNCKANDLSILMPAELGHCQVINHFLSPL